MKFPFLLLNLAMMVVTGTLLYSTPGATQVSPTTKKATRTRITKGPELERADSNFAIITWTSGNPGGSPEHYGVVHYGTNPKELNQMAKSPIRLNSGHSYTVFRVRMEVHHMPETNGFANPEALVTTEWAAEHGRDQGVRLVEVDVDTSAYERGHIEVIGCDEPLKAWKDPYHNDLSAMLSFLAFPVYVFGSGRGSMFLPPMDETAFPPIRRESPTEWIGRRTMRLLLGLGRPK